LKEEKKRVIKAKKLSLQEIADTAKMPLSEVKKNRKRDKKRGIMRQFSVQ